MIRATTPQDLGDVVDLLEAAFLPSLYEARIAREALLQDSGSHGWFQTLRNEIVGFVLYTPATRDGERIGFHLAPVAIHPDHQHLGFGSELIRQTLAMEPIASESVFVLGEPWFYERFGFQPVFCAICEFDEDNRHFRALRWRDAGSRFIVEYHPAFRMS